jgi:AraC-like DNA-binding protein
MTFIYKDRPSDSSLVETIWHARSERAGSFISTASTHWEMVVTSYKGKTVFTVRGPETQATPLHYQMIGIEWIGIRFKLGTFLPYLSPSALRDFRDVNLPEATGQSFWLGGAAWEIPDFENADTFVARLIREGLLVRDPVVTAVLRGQPHDLSPRSLQYHFLRATGLTCKTIQQIERAHQAKSLLEEGNSILDIVHRLGYYDQSHLTNSLKRFLGQTPAQIVRVSR